MGYIRHHAILVTSWNKKHLQKARDFAKKIKMTLTEITESPTKSYVSFAVMPDGSKEGWGGSEIGDTQRREFIKWLDSYRYEDGSSPLSWAEVQYGDDEGQNRITAHEREKHRNRAGILG